MQVCPVAPNHELKRFIPARSKVRYVPQVFGHSHDGKTWVTAAIARREDGRSVRGGSSNIGLCQLQLPKQTLWRSRFE